LSCRARQDERVVLAGARTSAANSTVTPARPRRARCPSWIPGDRGRSRSPNRQRRQAAAKGLRAGAPDRSRLSGAAPLTRTSDMTLYAALSVRRPTADLMLLATVGLWALNFTVSKYILDHGFHPLANSSIRYACAALIFAGITL